MDSSFQILNGERRFDCLATGAAGGLAERNDSPPDDIAVAEQFERFVDISELDLF